MTLKDLVLSHVVKDSDRITISKPLSGCACDMRKGNWFSDQVLDFMDCEIDAFTWDKQHGFSIALE